MSRADFWHGRLTLYLLGYDNTLINHGDAGGGVEGARRRSVGIDDES